MPFTASPTYASLANTGFATLFQTGSAASPPVYTSLLEIKTLNIDLITMPEVNKTHLLSPNNTEEFAPGMIHPGKISVGGNYIGDTSQQNIVTLAQAQTTFPFKIVASMQAGAKTATWTGNGFFTGHKVGPFENNKAIEFTGEIQMTGPLTLSVA